MALVNDLMMVKERNLSWLLALGSLNGWDDDKPATYHEGTFCKVIVYLLILTFCVT